MDEQLTDLTVRRLVERMASRDPVPGGGSASAMAGAMGAALIGMVVELTAGRPAAEPHADRLTQLGTAAAGWQSELLNLTALDANAYAAVVAARRLPRDTDLQRQARAAQVAAAVREATRVPLATARTASEVLSLADQLAPIASPHAISDVGVAALLAVAAVRGAALNVEINLPGIADDDELRIEATDGLRSLLADLDARWEAVHRLVAERMA